MGWSLYQPMLRWLNLLQSSLFALKVNVTLPARSFLEIRKYKILQTRPSTNNASSCPLWSDKISPKQLTPPTWQPKALKSASALKNGDHSGSGDEGSRKTSCSQPVMLSRWSQDVQGMSRVKSDKMVCTSSEDPGLSWMELAIQYACNKNDVT